MKDKLNKQKAKRNLLTTWQSFPSKNKTKQNKTKQNKTETNKKKYNLPLKLLS